MPVSGIKIQENKKTIIRKQFMGKTIRETTTIMF